MGGRGQTLAQSQKSTNKYMSTFKEKKGNSKTHDAGTDAQLKENAEYSKATKQKYKGKDLNNAIDRLQREHGVSGRNLTKGRILDARLENHGYKPHVEILNQQMSAVKRFYPRLKISSISTYEGGATGKAKVDMKTGNFYFNANQLSVPRLNKAISQSKTGRDYAHNVQKNLVARSFYQIAKENPVKMKQLKKTYVEKYGGKPENFQKAFINGMSKYISHKTLGEPSNAFSNEIGKFLKRIR